MPGTKVLLNPLANQPGTTAVLRGPIVKLSRAQMTASRAGKLGRFPGPELYDAPDEPAGTLRNGSPAPAAQPA